jgi:hypothetical protein
VRRVFKGDFSRSKGRLHFEKTLLGLKKKKTEIDWLTPQLSSLVFIQNV